MLEGHLARPPLPARGGATGEASWPGRFLQKPSVPSLQPYLRSSTPQAPSPSQTCFSLSESLNVLIPVMQRRYLLAGQFSGRATWGGVGWGG